MDALVALLLGVIIGVVAAATLGYTAVLLALFEDKRDQDRTFGDGYRAGRDDGKRMRE